WNRYGHAEGTPSEAIDPLGLWPFYIHNLIYGVALGGKLDMGEMDIIDSTSFAMDFARGQQNPQLSYEHSMSNGVLGEPPEYAAESSAAFINYHLQRAADIQSSWMRSRMTNQPLYSPEALVEFGIAVHTLTDSTSPSHAGFQPWAGGFWNSIRHEGREGLPYPDPKTVSGILAGIDLTAEAFNGIFPTGFDPNLDSHPVQVGWSCVLDDSPATPGVHAHHDPPTCSYYFKN